MKRIDEKRSIVTYIVLSVLTCGIFGYIFIYQLAQDINEMCKDDGRKTGGLGAFIVLSILSCGVYSLYWYYQIANRLHANASRYGISVPETGSDVLLWSIVGACGLGQYIAMHLIIRNTNAMAAAYNRMYGLA